MGLRAVSASEITANSSTNPSWNGIWLHGSGCERLTQIRSGQGESLSGGTVGEEVRPFGLPLVTGRSDLASTGVLVPLALHKHQGEGDSDLAVAGGERLEISGDSWHGVPFRWGLV